MHEMRHERGNVLDLVASAVAIRADKGAGQERGSKRRTLPVFRGFLWSCIAEPA